MNAGWASSLGGGGCSRCTWIATTIRNTASALSLSALLVAGSPASADDSIFRTQDREVRLGPASRTINLDGAPIEARIAALLRVINDGTTKEVRARIVADLADLHAQIGPLIRRLPLPKDNCARRGSGNLVVAVEGSDLKINGTQAIIEIRGEIKVWACLDNPFGSNPIKLEGPDVPFKAQLPIRLATFGPLSVGLEFDKPSLDLEGGWGAITGNILSIAGVDITTELDRVLRRAIRPEDLQASIPPEFRKLGPRVSGARFFSNGGKLAASIDLSLDLSVLAFRKSISSGPPASLSRDSRAASPARRKGPG